MEGMYLNCLFAFILCGLAALIVRKQNKSLFWLNFCLAVANGGLALLGYCGVFTNLT